mgnify:CR=1 FL=1
MRKRKYCIDCKRTLKYGDFWRDRSAQDGRTHYCKECIKRRRPAKPIKPTPPDPCGGNPSLKYCRYCGQCLPRKEFYERLEMREGRINRCKRCCSVDQRERLIRTGRWTPKPPRTIDPRARFRSHLRRTHKLRIEVYDEMVIKQLGRCPICGDAPEEGLCVDHCHACGKIRGLLCEFCNWALGFAEDSVEILQSALIYLTRSAKE